MFSHSFYIQGLPNLKQDTDITVRIPANAGQNFPVEVELPDSLLSDPFETYQIVDQSMSEESEQSLLPSQIVSAKTGISPLRKEPTLNTRELFLPSISTPSSKTSALSPRNQVFPSRDPSIIPGLASASQQSRFTAPLSGQSLTRQAISSGTSVLGSRPMTGQQLAEEILSTSSTSSPPINSISSASPRPSLVSSLTPIAPSTKIQSPTRMATPQQSTIQKIPSLSVAQVPTTLSEVILEQSRSAHDPFKPVEIQDQSVEEDDMSDVEDELADEEQFTAPVVDDVQSTGRALFEQKAKTVMADENVDLDSDDQKEAIDQAWSELTPTERAQWNSGTAKPESSMTCSSAEGCELPRVRPPSHRTTIKSPIEPTPTETEDTEDEEDEEPIPSVEPAKPSCNMTLLLMRYANPSE